MDLDFSADDIAFRDEARAFIAQNYPPAIREKQRDEEALTKEDYFAWHRILAAKGWSAPSWPVEWGGTGWTPTRKYIWSEEQANADTIPILPFGVTMVAPVIYTFGAQAQKERFLPGIRDGLTWWCQGYSEPGAGSDLASLTTKAERIAGDDGGEYYLVNGQKTWTTLAQFADWGFFLVRTDPTVKPQAGISFLLIDMKSPGVTVRPIITLEGGHEVNDVFLDNVKVPVENRIFHENQGWTCAKALLAHERIDQQMHALGFQFRAQSALYATDRLFAALVVAALVPDLRQVEPGAIAYAQRHIRRQQPREALAGLFAAACLRKA